MGDIDQDSLPDILTYRALRRVLEDMTDSQLDQRVQVIPSALGDGKVCLMPVYGIGTIRQYEYEDSRGAYEWVHDPDAVALLGDHHPFGPNGEIAYDMMTGEAIF